MMEGVMNPTEESRWPYYDYPYDDFKEYNTCVLSSNFVNVFLPVVYSLIFVVGILGNGLLLGVLIKKRKVWSTTDIFILHQAVADILLSVMLPFWAVTSASDAGWVFGTFFCKVSGSVFKMNLYCKSFLLVCISVSYLLSIIPSTKDFMKKKPWVVHACCVVVWILSILLSVPDWIFHTVIAQEKKICIYDMDDRIHNFSLGLYYTFGFVLPLIILVFCFFCVVWQLRCGTKGLQNQRAFIVVVVVAAVFFLCWTPYNITFWVYNNSVYQCNRSLNIALLVTFAVRLFHCCLNPILLLIVGAKYRQQQQVDQDIELTDQFS
ncbi:C-X-C chemokine receptor type 3-like [Poecilia reticulata]|uniref:C-X-C chemokine receptor type 3-like n=1 Tax=Poecilia reticulata TaxID=8081 RepID=UPI0004A3C6D0|nr:PREDICTED: C-X-C chemokine receptor type 3-like [Poecilia reticulata]XP_008429514.1 PREDICTED: C-X-C chemokine receptor type 3-like [Poecilia reticulata]XP_008429515.1 PREDICTED: C-X-C chemokine receptor type 3-like [Poecilia reticulata]XP_008429516.1 PREDICTED: C-X-C chemokine receptor type 3-like [Poecilia reticulata]XP_008429517.1 PREDICTED: C-X-C chemokine receptor type 3-like [Poecilia reticulata]XP_017165011.1 PREDICTED: C-X-C chemokine receptor type 3-like [Poecilia reticulata]